ncbi:meiotic nuclear division protein 1 homolog [Thrips palmi]|uniref:Meiotic nuclear division protein 1 homolog n=1 Tax=Thrips palmi TaxID=161013 RepID=A0A6P8ZPM2_THRPL|nr:meiotic nuclear division protein 1 homolog [Thrips palmi]XP_034244350.1 meiotic nuclear division protein 1 homolog [Thrips palmi]
MSKKKGVSAEDKRSRMLELFYEKKEFFQLKELEKMGPKEKGVIAQSVKDVIKSLCDDNLVDAEKIGTSVYFWAFPSKAVHAKKRQLEDLKSRLEEANKKLKTSREKVIAIKVGREDTEKRLQLLQKLQTMKGEEDKLTLEIQKFRDSDPEALEKMKKEIKIAKEAANRWTDNIFSTKSWIKNRLSSMDDDVLDKRYGIPSDMDYID